jgi:Na+/proline symporter
VSAFDWVVLFGALAFFVAYGMWRGRGTRDLHGHLLAGRSLPWYVVALSVMATQASAVTFLSTPGQGFVDGLRFVQFYFGLPLAMIVLCVSAVPIFHRLKVYTAYEYLEGRFDGKTRSLATLLFLIQRGLAAGITIYAPALVLSVILGWDLRWVCALLGMLAAIYTTFGGSKSVGHAHVLQFLIILATIAVAFAVVVGSLPRGVGLGDAIALAGTTGKLNAINLHFDPNDRYNVWSGVIGGFFLQMAYFGTDQSQVGRYLGGQSVTQSRLGLLFNGLFKVPMQFGILFLGVMVFVFYLFAPAPLFFNPLEAHKAATGPHAAEWQALETRHRALDERRRVEAQSFVEARRSGDSAAESRAAGALTSVRYQTQTIRDEAVKVIAATDPAAQTNDTNYVFLSFVLHYLPVGLVGLVLAAIFAASMNASSSELNALASTTVVDVVRRIGSRAPDARHDVWITRIATVAWASFAVVFAEYASRLGSLVEAVNILGSLFYGTILGIFLTAFYLPRVGGSAVFVAALVAETLVLACFKLTHVSFLWYNLIGCAAVMIIASSLELVWARKATVSR